jgi:hypothetical protein
MAAATGRETVIMTMDAVTATDMIITITGRAATG